MESYPPPPPPPPLKSQTNGLGIAGFVVSLVGLCTCVTFPVGLVMSLVALKKHPKGFAIAGAIIGGVGTLLLVAGLVVYFAVPDIKYTFETVFVMAEATTIIEEYRRTNDALPTENEGNELLQDLEDGWGNPLRYELDGERYVIRSAGPDGRFSTDDDILPTMMGRRR